MDERPFVFVLRAGGVFILGAGAMHVCLGLQADATQTARAIQQAVLTVVVRRSFWLCFAYLSSYCKKIILRLCS